MKVIACLILVAMFMGVSSFAAMQSVKYAVHDKERQNPPVITPPEQLGQPPSDAIVLFNGKDTSEWESERGGVDEVPWKVDKENGYMEVSRKGDGMRTKKKR